MSLRYNHGGNPQPLNLTWDADIAQHNHYQLIPGTIDSVWDICLSKTHIHA